ncbi:MAG: hypothetical protein IPJ98_27870 [Bryobacterales bacterium]|nr:hypothetical protein [Bryobacterales bacterium]
MPENAEQHGNDGCCRHCGARLSLVKRMSRQEFCSAEHREEYLRSHGDAALGRLQETSRPRPSSVQGLGLSRPATDPGPIKPTGSIPGDFRRRVTPAAPGSAASAPGRGSTPGRGAAPGPPR